LPQNWLQNLDTKQFINDWNAGFTLVDLQKKYALASPRKAKIIAANLGLQLREERKSRFDNVDIEKFSLMYMDNKITVKKIQREFTFADAGYVSKLAKQLGLPLRGKSHYDKFEKHKDQFRKMWEEGKTIKEIKKELDVSDPTIYHWRNKLHLQPRVQTPYFFKREKDLENSLIQKLLMNRGALTTLELGFKENQIKRLLKKKISDSVTLKLDRSVSAELTENDILGPQTGAKIVFLKDRYDCLTLKLSQIISRNLHFSRKRITYAELSLMLRNLWERPIGLFKMRDKLFELIISPNLQTEFASEIQNKLQTYSSKTELDAQKPHATIYDMSVVSELLRPSKERKFYGCQIEKERFIEELNNSTLESQKAMLKGLFIALNFYLVEPNKNTFYDFVASSNVNYYVKIMIYQTVTKTDLEVFSSELGNNNGIIITLQPLGWDYLTANIDNVRVLDKESLATMLDNMRYMPARTGKIAKIMYGSHRGKFVKISDLDLEQNEALVIELSSNLNLKVPIGSLNEIKSNSKIYQQTEQFINLLSYLSKVCSNEIISTLDESEIEITNQAILDNQGLALTAIVGQNIVNLRFYNQNRFIGKYANETGTEYCRNELLSCDCLAWLDQNNDVYLCRHIANLLFYLWEEDSGEMQISKL